ncbi:MAG: cytochrome d ubiquinol oxidase subunit II [Candidatus Acidiferrales bacterium]
MGTIWFCLVAVMLAGYVVLDGFDLGVGVLHLWITRNDAERRVMLRSIGPVWDGNEVWLVAAGGTLYFAFPSLYAEGLNGFYLPLITVFSLLVIRGISVEFRSRAGGRIWSRLWDAGFAFASALLAVFYGVALGNVVRGVPLNSTGHFFEPLWTNFQPVGHTGILDWYTVIVGVVALAALTLHGASWLAVKTEGEFRNRATKCASMIWWVVFALTAVITIISSQMLPQLFLSFRDRPWGIIFPILALTGLFGIKWFNHARQEGMSFGSSCAYLVGMLTSVTFSLYPNVLPSSLNPFQALTVANSKAADHGLKIGLIWWAIGIAMASGYTIHAYRSFAGKFSVREAEMKKGEEREHLVTAPR